MLNLHNIARGAITRVFDDEAITLYQAAGQKNVLGKVTPVYKPPQAVKGNIQPLNADTLKHLEQLNDTAATAEAFLYSDCPLPVSGIERQPLARGGDIILRPDGTYWLVTSVIEDWTAAGWVSVGIVKQVIAPDFAASDWDGESDVQSSQ